MNITLDQAKAFQAVAEFGTVQKAAKFLHKGHSAVLYLIKSLEDQTQLTLFDRTHYRNKITYQGEIVLKYCRQLLETQKELSQVCRKLKSDWEPSLKLIYDGAIDFNIIGDALLLLNESQVPTELKILAAYLNEVEPLFEKENADLMVTVFPVKESHLSSHLLSPIKMKLVAHESHKLTKYNRKKISLIDLRKHTYIKIRDTVSPIGLSTEQFEHSSSFSVNDFATKKQAILKGLGYGWLPEYLIQDELKRKKIQVLSTESGIETEHRLVPRLYHRKEETLGKTAKQLLKYFRQEG